MARLAKADIEQGLLSGKLISWKDANNKPASILLDAAKQRRLFDYLLKSKVREIKNLSTEFIDGLAAAFVAVADPAADAASTAAGPTSRGPWKIHALKVEGFGGVNAWKGKPLDFTLDGESLLIEGPNGSGKSSLTAAIIWGLTGERPRDQGEGSCEEARPVFDADDKEAGQWSPVATYPTDLLDLKLPPFVSVEITFSNPAGNHAVAKRSFDGANTIVSIDPSLQIPSILVEAGLLMPARLPQLRLDEGRGRLTDAVQKLTGLDDLIELGTFVQGICHKSRDYLSYKTAELAAAKTEFDRQIEKARVGLAPASAAVPNFKPSDTDDIAGDMATFGKTLNDKASDLTKVVSGDLAAGLDLTDAQVQKQIGLAVAGAEQDVGAGLEALPIWKTLQAVHSALNASARAKLREAITSGQAALEAAHGFYNKEQADNRYRLKAAGARWHAEHEGKGSIANCPLCAHSLVDKPELQKELDALRSAGEAATRRLADNVNAISVELEKSVPDPLKRYLSDTLTEKPKATLLAEIRAKFVSADRFTKYLVKCAMLADAACAYVPPVELALTVDGEAPEAEVAAVVHRIAKMDAICAVAEWFEDNRGAWETWWNDFAMSEPLQDGTIPHKHPEPLQAHLTRLNKALGEAEPYRIGAEAMRSAWKEGKVAAKIQKEQARRSEIADALSPLKSLGNLAEAQARAAINELSDRIGKIHGETYLAESFQFQRAALEKKTGLVVRGQFSSDIRIDATLVANTSWLRGVLWAFIFALREEAVEQMGGDAFPVLVLDDPQQTFDSEHRHRWAEQIAKLQKGTPSVQLLLATHEELFLSFLAIDGVSGRQALICSAGPELGHVGLFEGDALERRWAVVQKDKTLSAARDYMAAVRVFVEGMLKLMLRAEDVDISASVIGGCREKISNLHKAGLEPWSRGAFAALAAVLGKSVSAIKYIEIAHHASGAQLGMTEAVDVEVYWRKKLRSALERAFRIAREHRALHGGLTALHAIPPTATLPEGYKAIIRAVPLPLIGTAAALSDGRAADGCMDFTIEGVAKEVIELKDHVVFRITTPTLEPVARPGDLLLISEHTPPSIKSLVVAMNEDRLLARRLEIADNHSDVAVLTANAINPRMIAAPIVAKFSTLSLRKVVGVIFNHGKVVSGKHGEMEICDCGGEAYVKAAFSNTQGLVEVDGHSAEPYALDKQFLIIAKSISLGEADKEWEGCPVIAEDSNGSRYFKRYRRGRNVIILESLEIGGDFAPIVLNEVEGAAPHVKTVWPVLGVLFERPK
jgi:energy-coupling factor transporter ATP-binding protein EcfA2